jgi:hypothetical protein
VSENQPSADQTKRGAERRRNLRVSVQLPVVCYPVDPATAALGPSFDSTLVDVSTSGASIVIAEDVKVPKRVCVQIRAAEPPLDLLVMGRTVSVRRSPEIHCGIRFEDISANARADLTRFVFAAAKQLGEHSAPVAVDNEGPVVLAGTTLVAAPTAPAGRITVAEFAARIGQTEGSARRLLNTGLVPGARRFNPASKKSHWIIPATAPDDYLALFRRQRARNVFDAPRVGDQRQAIEPAA